MEMRSGRYAGHADFANHGSFFYDVPFVNLNPAHMSVNSGVTAAVIDDDNLTIPSHPAGEDDFSRSGRLDRRPQRRGDINARMLTFRFEPRMNPHPKAARYLSVRNRPVELAVAFISGDTGAFVVSLSSGKGLFLKILVNLFLQRPLGFLAFPHRRFVSFFIFLHAGQKFPAMSSGLLIGLLFPCALFMALRQLPARLLKLQFVAFQSQLFRFKSLDVSLVLTTQAVHEIRQVVELRQVRRREHYVQIGRTAVFVNSDAPLRKDILQSSDALIVLFNAFADLFELALVLFDLQIEQGNLLFGLLDAMIEHRQFAQIPFFLCFRFRKLARMVLNAFIQQIQLFFLLSDLVVEA
nr:hypothetical protein [Pyramidobacter piscolens]